MNTTTTNAPLSASELAEAERLLSEVHAARFQGATITEHRGVLAPLGGVTVSVRRGPVELSELDAHPGVIHVSQTTTTWCPAGVEVTARQVSDHHGWPVSGAPHSDELSVLKIEHEGVRSAKLADGTRVVQRTDVITVRPTTPTIPERPEAIRELAAERLGPVLGGRRVHVRRVSEVETVEGVCRQSLGIMVEHDAASSKAVFDALSELEGHALQGVGTIEGAWRTDCYSTSSAGTERQHFGLQAGAVTEGRVVVRWRKQVAA